MSDLMISELAGDSMQQIRKTAESPPRVSVFDVIGKITGHAPNQCNVTWARFLDQFPEIRDLISTFKFPGQGQRDTPVCSEKDLHLIVARLPGKAAADYRATGAPTNKLKRALEQDDLYVMKYSDRSNAVKIGRSNNVEKRRKGLESGQNFYVEIIATFPGFGRLEGRVHELLSQKRSTTGAGCEWFEVNAAEAVRVIGEAIAADAPEPRTNNELAGQ